MVRRINLSLLFTILAPLSLFSQGIYKEFGQNRVQYRQFEWKQLSHENLDILYYDNEVLLANNALEIAIAELDRLENFLSYKYGGAMQIVLFNSLTDYRQSNIGYTNPQFHSGGYLIIPNDVNSVYFNGNYADLKFQLRKSLCDIMLREMIYGGTLQDRIERVRSPMLPNWFTGGLSSFLSVSWSASLENELINAFSTHSFMNFNDLSDRESILAGHSIWRYLVEYYGAESVSTIMFISRYTHSAEAAIYFHTRKNMGAFLAEWREYYRLKLAPTPFQNLPKGTSNIPGRIARKVHTDFSLSPDGKTVALVTNDLGRFDIWTFDLGSGKIKHIYSGGQRVLNQFPDYDFPRIKWNPAKNNLTFITYEKGKYRLLELKNHGIRELFTFEDIKFISDFSFSYTGDSAVICGVKDGKSDLFLLEFKGNIFTQLSNDLYDDRNAIFNSAGNILFVSNRPTSEMIYRHFTSNISNLFILKNGKVIPLSMFNEANQMKSLISYDLKNTGFLSDISGLINAYVANEDSSFAVYGQTNYQAGILAQSISSNKSTLGEMLLLQGKYHIFTSQVPNNPISETVDVSRMIWKKNIGDLDSLFAERNIHFTPGLTGITDSVSRSVVDTTKRYYLFQTGHPKVDYNKTDIEEKVQGKKTFKRLQFNNSLQPDYVLSQSENRILGSYYQSNLIARNALRNPVVMPFIKASMSDVLKNYILEAGVRSSLDLMFTDFTTRFGIYRYRFNHELTVSRHSRKYEDASRLYRQHLSTQGNYNLLFPINEKNRVGIGFGLRQELNSVKATELIQLLVPDIRESYATGNLEYVYDNTNALGLNMMSGLRMAIGVDVIQRLRNQKNITNAYTDLRLYIPVYRKIIWANRFTAAYSLSSGKIAYYLGAVENWTVREQFERNTLHLNGPEYLFQQWVSNLRGFSRGVRMGSNFALVNTEIRIPILQTLILRPVESEFFKNFTVTGFCDAGTAFNGSSPADPSNPFNTTHLSTPNYDMTITSRRNPYILGLGYGIRSRFLGYFIKYDHGWGFMENQWQKPMNYLSIGFDF